MSATYPVVHHPVGITAADLPIGRADDALVATIRSLLAEHGVVILRGVGIDDAGFVAFLRKFGALTFTKGETPVDGFEDLNVVSNVGRTVPPRSTFHVDTSYVHRPPAYTALRVVTLPDEGGETLFTNQYRAAETLPPEVRAGLEGRTIRHVMTGLSLGEGEEIAADHPVLRPHPLSGRVALYLSAPQRCAGISGMGESEASDLIEWLFAHSTAEDNTYRHRWSGEDVVMWDNSCVMHRAEHGNVIGDRTLHRGMVAGYGSDPAPAGPSL